MKTAPKLKPTIRGFQRGEFKDYNGAECSVQESSIIGPPNCIWLGVNEPEPQVLAVQARRLGVITDQTTGWVPYPLPREVSTNTRMHLTQKDVKKLLPLLKHFAKHGNLNLPKKKRARKKIQTGS